MSDTDDIRRGDYGPVAAFGQSMIDGCGCFLVAALIVIVVIVILFFMVT